MFKLDYQIFKTCYDYCYQIGVGFGFNGTLEGLYINAIAIVGVVLIAINSKGAKEK